MNVPSPSSDSVIAHRYTSKSLEYKLQNKTALQKEMGWPAEPKRPMICLPAGMTEILGGELLKNVLPGILSLPVEILIRGKGSSDFGSLFTTLAKEQQHRIAIIANREENVRKMYAAADMALFCSDPSDQPELWHCLGYGAVPIAPETPALSNYDPVQETGNAFLYEDNAPVWGCFAALVRALETYRLPFDWRTIQRHGMESVTEK